MTNGEKRAFREKIKLLFKAIFSQDLMIEVVKEVEQEELARKAAAEQRQREQEATQPHPSYA